MNNTISQFSLQNFSEMYLSYSLNLTINKNSSYFSKIALIEFLYKPVSFDVNEVCEKHVKNQRKVKALLNGVDVGNEA